LEVKTLKWAKLDSSLKIDNQEVSLEEEPSKLKILDYLEAQILLELPSRQQLLHQRVPLVHLLKELLE
jgi:hypothetical protein